MVLEIFISILLCFDPQIIATAPIMNDTKNIIEPLSALMWTQPRKIVGYLDQSPATQFRLIAALTLLYFIQISIFVLSLEKLTIAPLLTLKGLSLIVYSIFTIGSGSVAAIYILTLAFWIGAKCFNGHGTLPQTRAAVIWTLVWSIPVGFFLLLIYFTIRQPNHDLQ